MIKKDLSEIPEGLSSDDKLMWLLKNRQGIEAIRCGCGKMFVPAEEMNIEQVRFNIWKCKVCFNKNNGN